MHQLFGALAFLHQKGIVHRNIKPTSVLYDPQTKKIKMVGFVPAKKIVRGGVTYDMLTRTGNLYFMAPEMLEGGGYRESVDVWAAGIFLYKLIAGHTPFENCYHEEVIRQIIKSELTFPPCFHSYSPTLQNFIKKLL